MIATKGVVVAVIVAFAATVAATVAQTNKATADATITPFFVVAMCWRVMLYQTVEVGNLVTFGR